MRKSITEKKEKIKQKFNLINNKALGAQSALLVLILFALSNTASFILGALSIKEYRQTAAIVSLQTQKAEIADAVRMQSINTVFASRHGKKYYFAWCKAGQKIKPANKVYFKDEKEAQKHGYTLSKSCK